MERWDLKQGGKGGGRSESVGPPTGGEVQGRGAEQHTSGWRGISTVRSSGTDKGDGTPLAGDGMLRQEVPARNSSGDSQREGSST